MSKDTTEAIHRMLADRYAGSEWAYLVEVPDGTGMKKQRTADAIAIGLWAKNAGQFHGFEVKSSRSDWTRELQEPEKSRRWREVVTSFWLVAGRGVAKLEEVPPDWGFLEVAANGDSLKIRKQPLHVERGSVPLNVVGAMLRKGIDDLPDGARKKLSDVDAAIQVAYAQGRDVERKQSERMAQRVQQLDAIFAKLHTMFGRSPESLTTDDFAVKLLSTAHKVGLSHMAFSMQSAQNQLSDWKTFVERLDDRLGKAVAEFDRIGDTVDSSKEAT